MSKEHNAQFQTHKEGSFAALFYTAIEPYVKRIERLEEKIQTLSGENKTLKVSISEAKKKAAEAKVKAGQKFATTSGTKVRKHNQYQFYTDVVAYLKETFRGVDRVSREKILANETNTYDSIRTELAKKFDSRILQESFITNAAISNFLKDAGLPHTRKQVCLIEKGEELKFSFFLIKRIEQ